MRISMNATRLVGGNQIAFVAAGCGGYHNLSGFKMAARQEAGHASQRTDPDGK
jgi:hypothetical protein